MATRGRSIAQAVSDFLVLVLLTAVVALPAAAQFPGPPSTTVINGHPLAPPPSVTSIAGQHLPNALPSVTSIPNMNPKFNYGQPFHGFNHRHGYGYGYGGGYAIPYYYPIDNSAYGYDYVGGPGAGPDLYSGPPLGPNDPTYHMIVEQPPARPYDEEAPESRPYASPRPAPEAPAPPPADVKPGEPTVLVFHTGKQQEVTNYAIMGDSLYVFDQGRKKIALADLDIPATIKANDDRGLEFRMPPAAKKKATTTVPQSTTPDQNSKPPANIAAAMP